MIGIPAYCARNSNESLCTYQSKVPSLPKGGDVGGNFITMQSMKHYCAKTLGAFRIIDLYLSQRPKFKTYKGSPLHISSILKLCNLMFKSSIT